MSHTTLRSGYTELVERLNRFPQGAPPSDTLYKILQILFSEREAHLVACLPIKPFTAEKASRIWKMDLTETRRVLDELSSRAILVDVERDGRSTYTMPPPMAVFFEFSMMRLRGDVDQKVLGELFYQYLNVEEEFIRDLFVNRETRLWRVEDGALSYIGKTACQRFTAGLSQCEMRPAPFLLNSSYLAELLVFQKHHLVLLF